MKLQNYCTSTNSKQAAHHCDIYGQFTSKIQKMNNITCHKYNKLTSTPLPVSLAFNLSI